MHDGRVSQPKETVSAQTLSCPIRGRSQVEERLHTSENRSQKSSAIEGKYSEARKKGPGEESVVQICPHFVCDSDPSKSHHHYCSIVN